MYQQVKNALCTQLARRARREREVKKKYGTVIAK